MTQPLLTSPSLPTTPLSTITINRERFREDNGDIDSLADSILKHGQLEPVLIDDNGELIAGFRRLSATRSLFDNGLLTGEPVIWAVRFGDLSERQAREIELEENLQRKQMSPAEQVKALAELHRLKQSEDPNWGQQQTAIAAGVHRSEVSEATKYAALVDVFPELKDAKSVRQLKSWADARVASVARVQEVKNNPGVYAAIEDKIWLGDSVQLIKAIPDGSFHAVITDPPFGIDFDERRAGSAGSLSDYEDSAQSYERLLSMAPDLYRVLRPNGWLVWFLGISWYERCKVVFREAGFVVDEIPIMWDRSDGPVHTNRPDRYMGRGYDIALHCIKGQPEMVLRNRPNVIRVKPVTSATTLVERPMELYAEIIRRLTIPGETVADFFVGSGSCPAAAVSLGRGYFGTELDPERRAYAIKKIQANTPEEK